MRTNEESAWYWFSSTGDVINMPDDALDGMRSFAGLPAVLSCGDMAEGINQHVKEPGSYPR
jgi:hypothetical protein